MAKLKKAPIQKWVEDHSSWRSPATRRSVIAIVQAAFNRAEEMHGVPNPLKGLKKGANHGFHNDTTPRYDEAAAKLAWRRTLDFFNASLR